jgi:outer membrane murein-binding lipoprotein Lpp
VARTQDLGAKVPKGVVTAGPWAGRESYIAETAVTLDRLTAKIARLEQREEALERRVAELLEQSDQAQRFQALAESLRNSREYKLDEIMRQMREARARVDALEGPRAEFKGLNHRNFIAVDRKLAELSAALNRSYFPAWLPAGGVAACFFIATMGALIAGRVL